MTREAETRRRVSAVGSSLRCLAERLGRGLRGLASWCWPSRHCNARSAAALRSSSVLPDLFQLARENAQVLEARWQSVLAATSGSKRSALGRFEAKIKTTARIAVNMNARKLQSFAERAELQNPIQFARRRPPDEGGDAETLLRQSQGKWYERRVCFDRAFVRGEEFQYGSLHLGGPGLTGYGGACVVFKLDATLA
jgi:hypothetical protein